ncbi:accessory Sec system translocase SecA2 [Nonomuraea roseoviolacea]|uniref:Protein translocase subunit SecA n=1 Tax=Nonomuraea roseoviolacea subsp. carminata TaxID=160689 RepID=A0ABT1K5C7_9ACTN|nr:accessory Sec system translocase SecA2 [Nonomuraea roseoviolacea]MCP2349090.1 preprotein translocase subunit SecA [Nonomuraea roseoviolacea subsp. carminata]
MSLGPYQKVVKAAGALTGSIGALDELPRPAMDDLARFCAVAREAADRSLGLRPYDAQLLGTLALLDGKIAEMATGEGKTLSGAMAAAGYALQGRRVHVMSVNDYLARRDAEWMAPFYAAMGVTVGWVGQSSTHEERREAYAKDVTYGAVSEMGFDVLRDRLRTDPAELIVPAPEVVLVDEADSVLVDEARVPLVMAGASDAGSAVPEMAAMVRQLVRGYHYEVDDQARNVYLTPKGADTVENLLSVDLYDENEPGTLIELNLALHAHVLLTRDVDYIVRDGKVQLINASRGRVALLQRWPDGLQAAVEAKEALAPSEKGEILDSITVQGLIRRYPQICGMTGTAVAVSEQLGEFYGLKVAVIPSNRPCVRVDEPDRVYPDVPEKEAALVEEIQAVHATGRPILIGTLDVAESENLARQLRRRELDPVVLNAKNDAEEASIIARAGERDAITVSTQMAGRGTDIRLGEGVAELGGLYVIGSGRHASSRLDDQLRGRAGRQGDPGGSVFFVSMRDDLVTQFAPDERPPAPDADGVVRHRRGAYVVAHAQRVAEGVNLQIHRNTWRYTRLLEQQRELILEWRDKVLHGDAAARALAEGDPERWAAMPEDTREETARQIVLHAIDRCWTEHLAFLTDLREGIHLRALGRMSPIDEFHREAVAEYKAMLAEVERRSLEAFEAPEPDLRRPTATWTYMVQDNPFGTEWDRILKRMSPDGRRR